MVVYIFMLVLLFIHFTVDSLYLPEERLIQTKNGTAEEIQHAICKITSKDLEATANATIFRELKGVCTSIELHTSISRLEFKLLKEMENFKNILKENGFKVPQSQPIREPINLDIKPTFDQEKFNINNQYEPEIKNDEPSIKKFDNLKLKILPNLSVISNIIEEPEFKTYGQPVVDVDERRFEEPIIPYYKDFELKSKEDDSYQEIANYNATVVNSNKGSIYFYYWKIQNIKELLLKTEMYKSSPEFLVLGHSLHLQFYPNYKEDETFAIHLGASTKGFIKKHKIYIINQTNKNADIESDLMFGFKGEESMFKVPEYITNEFGFVRDNSMIVKLEILLNS